MKYFTKKGDPKLFSCSCGECNAKPSPRLLFLLQEARKYAGIPFMINSGPRCPEHNAKEGGSVTSEHITGEAADIRCLNSMDRFTMIQAALHVGFTRVGISKDFIHLGVRNSQQSVVWLY
jgi:uncharacterized protein YcbK (DUF882 family)